MSIHISVKQKQQQQKQTKARKKEGSQARKGAAVRLTASFSTASMEGRRQGITFFK